MSTELVAAAAGLIGAMIGALASLGGTLLVERTRARHERRERLLGLFVAGVLGDRTRAVESKVRLATVARKERLHALSLANEDTDAFHAMNGLL